MSTTKADLLIVDDDDELRAGLVNYFSQLGHQVVDANCGEAAVGELENKAIAVAVLDMAMPGMSGIDLLKKIKAENWETEVVLLTGEGTIETAVEAMKYGAHDFPCQTYPHEATGGGRTKGGGVRRNSQRESPVKGTDRPSHTATPDDRRFSRDAGSVPLDRTCRPQ